MSNKNTSQKRKIRKSTKKGVSKWAALDKDTGKVVLSDSSLGVLVKKMEKMQDDYVLEKVLPPGTTFVHSLR